MDKKRHHYIPRAYLKFFCNDAGKVQVYRKDDPSRGFQLSPDSAAFHKYYYSQPRPEGGKDHNTLEDLFSTIEAKWPGIVDQLHRRQNVNNSLEDIFAFMALQRARVSASRDATERMLAEVVRTKIRTLDAAGKLPPKPAVFEDIRDHVEISIDPHQSIHAMVPVILGSRQIFDRVGIYAMHNKTDVPFLTSDNPVIWFDPSVRDADLRPYVLQPDGPIWPRSVCVDGFRNS